MNFSASKFYCIRTLIEQVTQIAQISPIMRPSIAVIRVISKTCVPFSI